MVIATEFLSTPSARRATNAGKRGMAKRWDFYPRPPRGGRRGEPRKHRGDLGISIHALREEGDYTLMSGLAQLTYFYPRPPRGGRPEPQLLYCNYCTISIHALREEGDYSPTTPTTKPRNFYPRPPRGGRLSMKHCPSRWRNFYPRPPRGGRRSPAAGVRRAARFLSTPSARRATPTATPSTTASRYFYPRPPRGGRPGGGGPGRGGI